MRTAPLTIERHQRLLQTVLGPLEPLLRDPTTAEVIINPDGRVWYEPSGGTLALTEITYTSNQVGALITTVAGLKGEVCTAAHPSLSAMLPGTRVRFQGDIPPASRAPQCVMRRLPDKVYSMAEQIAAGVLTETQTHIIRTAVERHENIIVAGKTGSGKTTFQTSLMTYMQRERLVTIEDTAEMLEAVENWYPLYTSTSRPMSVVLQEALRDRPDRLIVGEVRGVEAVDLLDSWNTGHPGGIATVHASTPRETLARLEDCMRQVSPSHPTPLPLEVSRPKIASTVNLIVCLERTQTGRRVSALARVCGLAGNDYHLESLMETSVCEEE